MELRLCLDPLVGIGAALQQRRVDVADQIKARKRDTAGNTSQAAGDLADHALAGNAAALTELVGAINARPLAFEAGLADRITETMACALAEAGDVFAQLLE